MAKSRLKNHLQKKAVQNILLAFSGIVIVFVILFFFGTQILINFSLLIEKLKGSSDPAITNQEQSFLVPPSLNPIESATNSAKTIISGYSLPKQTIHLYVNGELVDKTQVQKDKSFTFNDVELKPGENDIKAKAVTEDDKQSDYSTTISVNYINKLPTLDIESPSDGQSFSKDQKPLKISGKTDSGNRVTVNSFWAIVNDEGKFTYTMPLQNGENKIKIEAQDDAGNKTTKEIKVTYSE